MLDILNKINQPEDLRNIEINDLEKLSEEIREVLLQKLSKNGGHFGPNFGMVEAIIAMHYVFDSPKDKFVFDVSHQSYAHKILTGRKEGFIDENSYRTVSGYTNPDGSEHDFFNVGHTSTSISLASGLAKARDLKKEDYNVVAVIGDGSLSGGEALEGLNFAGSELNSNFIIIVNDNQQSIAENHGGLYKNLDKLRETNGQASNNLFKAMGLDYIYEADGNNIEKMIELFQKIKDIDHPIVVHINTIKGKGYKLAEENREAWHWSLPFDIETGNITIDFGDAEDYGDLTAKFLLDKMKKDNTVVAVTPAMPMTIGFGIERRQEAGEQFVDVGIAEEHAVTFAAGLAAQGMRPVFAVYSSFLQRGYDQVLHDVCIQKLPVFFGIDRSGLVGADGETHQGIFDISYLSHIPNMVLMAPKNEKEMPAMMKFALEYNGPIAMKYPRGSVYDGLSEYNAPIELGKSEMIYEGQDVVILAVGNIMEECEKAVQLLKSQGYNPGLVNVRFIRPMDEEMLHVLSKKYSLIVTVEENQLIGGYGQMVSAFLHKNVCKNQLLTLGISDYFVGHATVNEQREEAGINADSIVKSIIDRMN